MQCQSGVSLRLAGAAEVLVFLTPVRVFFLQICQLPSLASVRFLLCRTHPRGGFSVKVHSCFGCSLLVCGAVSCCPLGERSVRISKITPSS